MRTGPAGPRYRSARRGPGALLLLLAQQQGQAEDDPRDHAFPPSGPRPLPLRHATGGVVDTPAGVVRSRSAAADDGARPAGVDNPPRGGAAVHYPDSIASRTWSTCAPLAPRRVDGRLARPRLPAANRDRELAARPVRLDQAVCRRHLVEAEHPDG